MYRTAECVWQKLSATLSVKYLNIKMLCVKIEISDHKKQDLVITNL